MESGVDSAHFAHTLCDYMASAAYAHNTDSSKAPLAPRALMQQGYDEICEDRDIKAGGSTACVAVASEDGKLEVANLGDSGFIHIRLNAVYSHSEPQTHAFNTPYQLSIVPRSMLARAAAFGGAQLCDYPKDADVTHHDLQPGDVIIMASDGVWDNLFTHELLQTVSQYMRKSGAWKKGKDGLRVSGDVWRHIELDYNAKRPYTLPSAIASEIAGAARAASMNTRRDGPFAKEVQRNYPSENWRGGKLDDICVVVVVVSDNRRETDPIESKL
ncbi:phosphatase 2C-like domain-containing protein [Nemania sp. FL0916]|nr:phosphatase 2C-like domain-containing protein [Nemania sp. FL0916]